MASLGLGKVTPGAHWKPGDITAQQSGTPNWWVHPPKWGGVRPRVQQRPDGTYGRDPRYGTPINTEEQAQDLMDPRTPGGRQLQDWAEGERRQMFAAFRKRMMRDM